MRSSCPPQACRKLETRALKLAEGLETGAASFGRPGRLTGQGLVEGTLGCDDLRCAAHLQRFLIRATQFPCPFATVAVGFADFGQAWEAIMVLPTVSCIISAIAEKACQRQLDNEPPPTPTRLRSLRSLVFARTSQPPLPVPPGSGPRLERITSIGLQRFLRGLFFLTVWGFVLTVWGGAGSGLRAEDRRASVEGQNSRRGSGPRSKQQTEQGQRRALAEAGPGRARPE